MLTTFPWHFVLCDGVCICHVVCQQAEEKTTADQENQPPGDDLDRRDEVLLTRSVAAVTAPQLGANYVRSAPAITSAQLGANHMRTGPAVTSTQLVSKSEYTTNETRLFLQSTAYFSSRKRKPAVRDTTLRLIKKPRPASVIAPAAETAEDGQSAIASRAESSKGTKSTLTSTDHLNGSSEMRASSGIGVVFGVDGCTSPEKLSTSSTQEDAMIDVVTSSCLDMWTVLEGSNVQTIENLQPEVNNETAASTGDATKEAEAKDEVHTSPLRKDDVASITDTTSSTDDDIDEKSKLRIVNNRSRCEHKKCPESDNKKVQG